MSVTYVVIFTTLAIVPPCDSTSALMHSNAPRACALKSPRNAGLPSFSYATWPERNRIVCAPVTLTPWLYVAGSKTFGAQNLSIFTGVRGRRPLPPLHRDPDRRRGSSPAADA